MVIIIMFLCRIHHFLPFLWAEQSFCTAQAEGESIVKLKQWWNDKLGLEGDCLILSHLPPPQLKGQVFLLPSCRWQFTDQRKFNKKAQANGYSETGLTGFTDTGSRTYRHSGSIAGQDGRYAQGKATAAVCYHLQVLGLTRYVKGM